MQADTSANVYTDWHGPTDTGSACIQPASALCCVLVEAKRILYSHSLYSYGLHSYGTLCCLLAGAKCILNL